MTKLSGDLPSRIKKSDSPYLVTADIVVPPGDNVTIEPGVCLLFGSFTGLQIHGALHAEATAREPIVFTSEHDPECGSQSPTSPAPYDWNGITVNNNAIGTSFKNCQIRYSLFGINSFTKYVSVDKCIFSKNGKAHLTIDGTKQEVLSDAFTYIPPDHNVVTPEVSEAIAVQTRRNVIIRSLSISAVVAGAAIGGWKKLDYSESNAQFNSLSDASKAENQHNPNVIEDWESAKNSRDEDLAVMITGFSAAAIGAAVLVISLF